MTNTLGEHAVVVGAGMGGLSAAAALSPYFGRVTVIDKDKLPSEEMARMGVGQGAHTHQLLKGGEEALERLLPGLRAALYAAGAAEIKVGRNVKVIDAAGVMPQCDPGFSVTALSRPRYERVLREKVAALGNVTFRDETEVQTCIIENGRCAGVVLADGERIAADLVVDSSGMNGPLAQQLIADGEAEFETEMVKINCAYSTARFDIPEAFRGENMGYFVLPGPPLAEFALMLPIEDNQWTVSLGVRGNAPLPKNIEEFLAFAKRLVLPEVYERLKDARPVSDFKSFRKAFAIRRKIGEAARWPDRLVPLGDSLTSYNPTFGQGMSVAALQAGALAAILAERAATGGGLDGVVKAYLPLAEQMAAVAWNTALSVDYAYPETEGPRPADFGQQQFVGMVVRKMASEDMEILALRLKMIHMIDSGAAMREGPIADRIAAAIQAAAAAQAVPAA